MKLIFKLYICMLVIIIFNNPTNACSPGNLKNSNWYDLSVVFDKSTLIEGLEIKLSSYGQGFDVNNNSERDYYVKNRMMSEKLTKLYGSVELKMPNVPKYLQSQRHLNERKYRQSKRHLNKAKYISMGALKGWDDLPSHWQARKRGPKTAPPEEIPDEIESQIELFHSADKLGGSSIIKFKYVFKKNVNFDHNTIGKSTIDACLNRRKKSKPKKQPHSKKAKDNAA